MNKLLRQTLSLQTAVFGGLFLMLVLIIGYWITATNDVAIDEPPLPVISVHDILNTQDFMDAALALNRHDDPEPLEQVFAAAVTLAEEAGLDQQALAYLRSSEAQEYVLFRAKREEFWHEVEQHYRQLLPIAPLQSRFPEARDLFAKADALEQSREQTLLAIAEALAAPGEPTAMHHAEAQRLWQERHSSPHSTAH